MDDITRLAEECVTRAWGFCGLAVLMVMMGTLSHPHYSFLFGALGAGITGLSMAWYGLTYHRHTRVEDMEVWLLLAPDQRPQKAIARAMITVAMRDALFDKARISAGICGAFLLLSIILFAYAALKAE